MNVEESLRSALQALAANKLRALLTMLGIIIGVASVITMLAIGEGAQKSVTDRIQALGSNLLMISPGVQRGAGTFVMMGGTSVKLKNSDANALRQKVVNVDAVTEELSRQAQVKFENRNWNTRVVGTVPSYEHVRNVKVVSGRYFTNSEERGVAKVCLLGPTVVEQLFPSSSPLGKSIRIAGQLFSVIGVLESKGQSGFMNSDDQVLVPLATAQRRLFGVEYLSQITVKTVNDQVMTEAMYEIERTLRREHKLRTDQDNDFTIRNQSDILTTFQETQQTFTYLLAGIAAVSLLVGGIGIMNIMIVSVTERTKEIGIRKAVGARRADIMSQFLIESIVISVSGGCVGILSGIAAAIILSSYGSLATVISLDSIVMSFGFASCVGVAFGVYPAWKAAEQGVIEALRYE
ncbi:MAG: ABC transporter permease [Ignavibacteriae bacterium]|nr:ABC transporter permease [Ignavibacteriota bacterium]